MFASLIESLEQRRLLSMSIHGIGAIGDSYTDEYQFYSPDRCTAENYVEQLAANRHLNFGEFSSASMGAPRNAGYAYNWAQSGDTSVDAMANGQLAGLVSQVATGKVDMAFVFIGGDDFRAVFASSDPVGTLQAAVPTAITNVLTTVGTVLAANPNVNVVVATVPKISILPEVNGAIASGYLPQALADAVDNGIEILDGQIRNLAASSDRVALADVDKMCDQIFAKHDFHFGGVEIDRYAPADDPSNLFLADGIHAGTIGQGMLANLFIKAMDKEFGAHIAPLSKKEILADAGLRHGHAKPVPSFSAVAVRAVAGQDDASTSDVDASMCDVDVLSLN